MVKWLPIFTLKQFRKSEDCCLMITNPAKDLDGYTKWKSRSDNHHDAVAIRASDKYHEIGHNRWALNFKNNLYSIDHVSLSSGNNIFLFLTFQTFSKIFSKISNSLCKNSFPKFGACRNSYKEKKIIKIITINVVNK